MTVGRTSAISPLQTGYDGRMTAAAEFIAQLRSERLGGNVSGETGADLKHDFRKLGQDASDLMLSSDMESEIDRLEQEAATLHRFRKTVSGTP